MNPSGPISRPALSSLLEKVKALPKPAAKVLARPNAGFEMLGGALVPSWDGNVAKVWGESMVSILKLFNSPEDRSQDMC